MGTEERDFSGYAQTHNTSIYGWIVQRVVETTDDYYFVCNRFASLYQEIDDGCVDNERVSKSIDGKWDEDYHQKACSGCCGSIDRELTNEATGNSFFIGFNYGH